MSNLSELLDKSWSSQISVFVDWILSSKNFKKISSHLYFPSIKIKSRKNLVVINLFQRIIRSNSVKIIRLQVVSWVSHNSYNTEVNGSLKVLLTNKNNFIDWNKINPEIKWMRKFSNFEVITLYALFYFSSFQLKNLASSVASVYYFKYL